MDKKALKKTYKAGELKAFRESLPMKETDFLPLFDFLDRELSENGCQNDLSLLEKYCEQEKLDFTKLKEWFKKQGEYCDCEIISNVEELFGYLTKPTIIEIKPKKMQTVQRRKLDTLTTDFGFSIKKVPMPWILNAISQGNSTAYQFQIGKKSDFPVTLESDFAVEMLADDKFLQEYWLAKTELDSDLEFVTERQLIQGFETIQVRTKRWSPAFVFIYKQELTWCLVLRTETSRVRNDMRELEKLLKEM